MQLHGVVVDDPVELFEPGEAYSTEDVEARIGPDRQVCVVALRHRKASQDWQPIAGRVRATIHSPRQLVRYGDEVVVEGQWSRVPAPGNPGQYDWQAALARKRIHGLLRVRPFDGVAVLRGRQGNPVLAAVFRLRERWERLIRAHFNARDAGLLLGLLLGQRAEIDEELKEAFVNTGTVHLLVISGFNVGLIALLFEGLFRLLGLPWRWRLLCSAAGLGIFCLLTGVQPPVARATLMAWVVLGSLALDRTISWPNTLAAAALAILWVNPTQLFEPSFQLSFGAVLSLLVFAPRAYAWLDRALGRLRPDWSHHLPARLRRAAKRRFAVSEPGQVVGWLRRYAAASLSGTAAVWVGLSPALAWYFHLLSPVSILANLIVGPLMSLLVVAGTAALAASTVFDPILRWAHGPLTLLLEATVRSVLALQSLPGGHWAVPAPSGAALAGYYALIGVSVAHDRLCLRRGRVLAAWALGLTVWLWSLVALRAMESRWLRVDVLDVGHGDSILVRLPSGGTVLVDAGTEEAGRFNVLPALRAAGVTSLDALVLTHPDEDHIGGAIPLLEELPVRRLLTNGVADDTMSARRVRRLAGSRGIPETALAAGARVTLDDGAVLDVLHPPPGLVPGAPPPSNDNSLVLKVTKGSVSVLLTGDIEEIGVPVLLDRSRDLHAAVLKVPHHGSRLGRSGDELIRAVRPRLAVLSVGRVHHLPAAETLDTLRRHSVRVLSTRDAGAVQLRTDGERLEVRTFRGGGGWEVVR
ncbi:MAG: DNA internalization-related competence protein ComEC/Rec2 [Omnitrophica WOR_2 bacterium RIFCSPHIGHO2_02_FULL_67_20]|nr:MAG: DNA internalization-related competence protein ComEC/Rec2 [Omnitrophica WOR_2 bacterium RIFCSPHIGHO2_02_FULL_67_20]